jgi:hypothetical protein
MRRRPRILALTTTIFLLWPAAQIRAQDVGDSVVPKSEIKLKIKSEIIDTVGPADELVVEQVRDEWLWVKTPAGKNGWVKKDAVTLRQDAPPPAPEDAAPASPDEPETPIDPESDRLYLIGAMGGSHVYTTYAYIGVLADSLSKDVYTNEQVTELLNETVAMSESLLKQLRKVRAGGLSETDAQAIENMIEIYRLLQDEARAAAKFAESRAMEDAEKFDQVRTTVWPRISALLGLEQTADETRAP